MNGVENEHRKRSMEAVKRRRTESRSRMLSGIL